MLAYHSSPLGRHISVLLCTAALATVTSADTDVYAGTITGATTWTLAGSPYVVHGTVTVQSGGSLTIEPGVEVRFAGNYALNVGSTSAGSQGTLTAIGGSTNPITFCADGTPGAGAWQSVRFQAGATASSEMDHCVVRDAGSSTAAVVCISSSPSISNLTVEDSGSDAVYLNNASPELSGTLSLIGDGGYLLRGASLSAQPTFTGVTLSSPNAALGLGYVRLWSSFFAASPTLSGGPYRVEVVSGTLDASATWGGLANLASIDLQGDLTIQGAAQPVLTIAAGTTVRLPANGDVFVGYTSTSLKGDLVAAGTAQDPVRFESSGTVWGHIQFRAGSTAASALAHCVVADSAGSTAAVYCVSSSPALANLTVEDPANDAIYLNNATPSIGGAITQTGGTGYLIRAASLSAVPAFSGVTLSSSGKLAYGYPPFWSSLFASAPALLGGPHRAEVVSGTVDASATWGGVANLASIDLLGDLTIQGAAQPVLTIAAGTTVRLPVGGDVFVGYTSASLKGDLVVAGTAQDPVRFEASTAGTWGHVQFRAGSTSASSLAHCVVAKSAGSTAALYCISSSPSLANVTVENPTNDAIYLNNATPSIAGAITQTGGTGYLIRAASLSAVPAFSGVTLSSSGKLGYGYPPFWSSLFASGPALAGGPYRAEVVSGTVDASATWGGVANLASIDLLGDLTIQGSAAPVLTIAAGTTMRLPVNGDVFVGYTSTSLPGDLVVAGTAQDPVRFESSGAVWGQIQFRAGSTSASSLAHCTLADCAGAQAAIYCTTSSPSLANVTVEDPVNDAIYLINASPSLSGAITLTGGTGYLFRASSAASVPSFSGVMLTSSGKLGYGYPPLWSSFFASGPTLTGGPYRAEVSSGTIGESATWGGVANLASIDVTGVLTVAHTSAPVLTVAPGTTMRFANAELAIGTTSQPGSLQAIGTAGQPIVFTSSNASPAAGQWYGISIASQAGACALERCTVEYGGGGSLDANVRTSNADTTVRLCTIRESAEAGVKVVLGRPRIELNLFSGNAQGLDVLTGGQSLVVRNNTFAGNTVGVRSVSSLGFSAALNAWGDPSGPSGVGSGSGDSLTGNVIYEPWLESTPAPGFEWLGAAQSPDPFTQTGGATEFHAAWNEQASWTLEIRDGGSALVRSFSGTGAAVAQVWEGDDGAVPSAPLADGDYTWSFAATGTGSLQAAPAARGRVTLDGSLPIARITSPDPDELVAGTVTIEGTAAGMDFDSYTVGYKSGIDPAGGSWVTIASSATPVTDGVLATWNASTLNTPTVSLRLSVATTGVATAQDVVVVPLLAITSIATAPTFLSPNGDAVQDETALTAALSWPADWELTVAPVGGGPAVRTYQGSASAVAQAWDGADELAAVVADGEYTLALEATAPGGASTTKSVTVEVDTVAPVAAITTPTAQQMVLSHEPFQIEGAAHDDHFKLYQLSIAPGAPPGAFTTLKSSAVPVEGIPTMDDLYLLPTQSYASDVYTLRLAVSDDAGNVSTLDREFELDYIQITDVGSTPAVIDPAASETAEIAYTVNRDCDVAVDLHAWPAGVLIRTLTQTGVLAGPNTAMWDGLDDLGVFSTPEVLHYFVIQATDASGRTGQYNDATTPKLGPSGSVGGISIDTAGFDPYANDEIEVEFNITGLARSQIWVKGSNLFLPLSETGVFPPGQHVGRWDGRNQLGGLHQGAFSFFVDDPSNLPSPAIYLAREPIRFADFRAEAYLIHPVFGQVSGFTYELTRDAVVTITVEDPNGNHVRTLLTAQPQTAGVYDLDDGIGWDGRDDAGNVVSLEGTYTVVLSATDLLTGKVHVRRGNVTVYR